MRDGNTASSLLLLAPLMLASASAFAQVPCQECWNDSCKEFKGLIPKCAATSAPKRPPGPTTPKPDPEPEAAAGPCLKVPECNARCGGGELSACVTLGSMFDNGIEVAEDKSKAAYWYRVACDGGSQQGCLRLKAAAAAAQRIEEEARAAEEARARELEASRRAAELAAERAAGERLAREAEQRRKNEEAARQREATKKTRLCGASPPFHSPVQAAVPFTVTGELESPAYCGLTGDTSWTVPFDLQFEEELTFKLSHSCNTATCTLKMPSGRVLSLTDVDLKSLRIEPGRSEFTFSQGSARGALTISLSRVTACEPGDARLPVIKEDTSTLLRDLQAGCVLDEHRVHFVELERGSLAEKESRPGFERFGHRTVHLVLSDATPDARANESPAPILYRLDVRAGGKLKRLDAPATRKARRDVRFTMNIDALVPAEERGPNPYRVFAAIPVQGPTSVRRLTYEAPFSLHGAFNLQVAALAATDLTFGSGGVSLLIGGGLQLHELLGLDFNALAHLRGNDYGPAVSASPVMVGLRVGRPRNPRDMPMWARLSMGPVLRAGTGSTFTTTQVGGFGFRLDYKPFNGFALVLSAQADLFAYEPTVFLFNLGFGL